MRNAAHRFRCPACGFVVYNRRVAKCESCSALLPAELRYTPEELQASEAEHEGNEAIRRQVAREAREEVERLAAADVYRPFIDGN